jgi:DNA topoisomerase-1
MVRSAGPRDELQGSPCGKDPLDVTEDTSRPRRRGNKALKRLVGLNRNPQQAAAEAHLTYVSEGAPGISRHSVRRKNSFAYRHSHGGPVRDAATLDRIRKLAIPPAYRDVWICVDPDGHLQATGRDARGRRQYRYHPKWREVRDQAKFAHMMVFARALPVIRARVAADLSLRGLPRERVLAAVVKLLETTLMRVGNEEYAQTNKSFGLTTLRNRHVRVKGRTVTLDFSGKHGITHHVALDDARLARLVSRCQDLPGQELFQNLDQDGAVHSVGSDDVNRYLKEITGLDVTAKDFRTWAGTNLAALALQELASATAPLAPKKTLLQAVEAVSKLLGNTPAICRKCYIHPAIFEGYLDGSLLDTLKRRATEELAQGTDALKPEEAAVMGFLAHRLMQAVEQPEAEPRATPGQAKIKMGVNTGRLRAAKRRSSHVRPHPVPPVVPEANA